MLVCDVCKDRRKPIVFRVDIGMYPKVEIHLDLCYDCSKDVDQIIVKRYLDVSGDPLQNDWGANDMRQGTEDSK